MDWRTVLETAGQILSAVFIALFGEWTLIVRVFFVLIFLDYVSGLMKAVQTGTLDSYASLKGLMRKTGYLILVAVFHQVGLFAGIPEFARNSALSLLVVHESVSIVENLHVLGGKDKYVPEGVVSLLERVFEEKLDVDRNPE